MKRAIFIKKVNLIFILLLLSALFFPKNHIQQKFAYADEEEVETDEEYEIKNAEKDLAKEKINPIFSLEKLLSHPHNKVVHFPIALGITAGLFDILSFFNPAFEFSAKSVLAIATAGAVAAYFTGEYQEELSEEKNENVLEFHEKVGFLAMLLYIIAFLLRLHPRTQKISKILAILLVPFISLVGYLGGIVAHG